MRIYYKVHEGGVQGFRSTEISDALSLRNPHDLAPIACACAIDFRGEYSGEWSAPISLYEAENGPEVARLLVAATVPRTIFRAEKIS